MLSIKNLHASIGDKEFLKESTLSKSGRNSRPLWDQTVPKKYLSAIIAGNENYEVTEGEILLDTRYFGIGSRRKSAQRRFSFVSISCRQFQAFR